MPQPRKFDHDQARRRYEHGETIGALAREYGVAEQSISNAIKGAGGIVKRAPGATAKDARRDAPPVAVLAAPDPPTPREVCAHTTCNELATRVLKHGQFKHHLALSKAGLTRLNTGGAPVCDDCWSVATRAYPCSTDDCEGASKIQGNPCPHCVAEAEEAARPPAAPSSSVFPNGPFPGPAPRAARSPIAPPDLDRAEQTRLRKLEEDTERRRRGELHMSQMRPASQEPPVRRTEEQNGSGTLAAVADPDPDPAPPGLDPEDERVIVIPDNPAIENGEIEATSFAFTIGQDEIPVNEATLTRINVARDAGSDWSVDVERIDLDLHITCPNWDAVERVLATVLRDRAFAA